MKTPHEPLPGGGEQPTAIRLIADAVAKLTPPPLRPLYQTYLEVQAGVQEKCNALERERMALREAGFEAATRLMLSRDEDRPLERPPYFERLQEKRS